MGEEIKFERVFKIYISGRQIESDINELIGLQPTCEALLLSESDD